MTPQVIQSVIHEFATLIATGKINALLNRCSSSRLTALDIQSVVSSYGKTFIPPTDDINALIDVVEVKNSKAPTWSVWAPLWTKEEGRSDLTLELTIKQSADGLEIELDDIHVL